MLLASLDNQVVFKKLLSDPEILKAFIKDLMGIDLQPTTIETEKKFSPPIGNVDIEIDIFAEDPTHRLVIEIQKERYEDDFDRFWHYHQVATIEMAKSYKAYQLNRTVCTIVWLTRKVRDRRYHHSLITTHICSETEDGERLTIYPHRLYFLNPFYPNDKTPAEIADWLKLVVESIVHPDHPDLNMKRPFMQRAIDLIADDGLTPQERARIMDEVEYENRRKNVRQEGRQEGEQEKAKAIARNLLAEGLDPALIAKTTGLTIEEVTAT
jgi:hypothetical protein